MLDQPTVERLAQRLDDAERSKSLITAFTREFPDLTIEDAYAIQRAWTKLQLARGRVRIAQRQPGLRLGREPILGRAFRRRDQVGGRHLGGWREQRDVNVRCDELLAGRPRPERR